ncbi:MAG: hypothetical protein ACJAUP_002061 [Cellvibrionaceae bacterium]|jgi:uncharacterized protein YjiS (DUF1127 family)
MKLDYETLISQAILLPRAKSKAKYPGFLSTLKGRLTLYSRNATTRRQLKSLSLEQLRDVGITPEQAEQEAAKYCWEK